MPDCTYLYLADAQALPVGAYLIATWYELGTRSAAGKIVGVRRDAVKVAVCGAALKHEQKYLFLEAPEDNPRRLVDRRSEREYTLRIPTDRERTSCAMAFGDAVQQELFPVVKMSVKEIAIKLLGVLSATPRGSKKLAELAGVEYSDTVLEILKRLNAAGKVRLVKVDGKGKWVK